MGEPISDGSAMLDWLRLREAERAAEAARRQESVASEGVGPRESVQAFLAEFASSRRALEALLEGAAAPAAAGEAGGEALGRVQSGIAVPGAGGEGLVVSLLPREAHGCLAAAAHLATLPPACRQWRALPTFCRPTT